ncbi:MAG: carotenoid biosynthesis protein [Crocinitomicaceae bacterium]|nr:carotenoid biosynthesis protein [Crocinitomicaceae bacterium]
MTRLLSKNIHYWFTIIFYSVGVIGISLKSFRELFLPFSWGILLLSFLALMFSIKAKEKRFYFFLSICFFISMISEIIGVQTGFLFGDYYYGTNLGFKVFGVPIIIGLNWVILLICSASFFTKIKSRLIRVFVSAVLMVIMDYLMEPVAVGLKFWIWKGDIPIYNFICWFILSLVLHFIYDVLNLNAPNKYARFLFCILALFFVILNFT